MNVYDLKSVVVGFVRYNYFYNREKNDRNGNPRFRVWILDPDGGAVYEEVFTTYNLENAVKNYIENY